MDLYNRCTYDKLERVWKFIPAICTPRHDPVYLAQIQVT